MLSSAHRTTAQDTTQDTAQDTAQDIAQDADVVIIGAGIAGLAAAHHLTSAGVTVSVLEAAPYVGGRMATDRMDGFLLDRGGQLLTTSYPELLRTPGLEGAALRMFSPGVLVHSDGRSYRSGAVGGVRNARNTRSSRSALRTGAVERRAH